MIPRWHCILPRELTFSNGLKVSVKQLNIPKIVWVCLFQIFNPVCLYENSIYRISPSYVVAFFRFEFGLNGAALRWSLAMIALLAAGYLLRDADFRLQAYVLAAAVSVRAIGFDFQHANPVFGINGPLAVAVVGAVAYVAAGFLIRERVSAVATTRRLDRRSVMLESRLETLGRDLMWLLAVALAALYLYRTQSGSMLIVTWALEGLAVTGGGFIFKARSLRLAGLGLLGIALATTLVRAFTTFDTVGRIVSFLIMGVVLLLVSFAYTRYRSQVRKSP